MVLEKTAGVTEQAAQFCLGITASDDLLIDTTTLSVPSGHMWNGRNSKYALRNEDNIEGRLKSDEAPRDGTIAVW